MTGMEFSMPEPSTLLRHEPVQARSNARLTGLLDAAAATIDHVGYERLTTAMVAERANASIGTVYRYFPDRIAVLQGVATRAISRFLDDVDDTVTAAEHPDLTAAVDRLLDRFADAFHRQPAFAALRFGDVLDLRPRGKDTTGMRVVAERMAHLLDSHRGSLSEQELSFHLEVAFTLADALLARAFWSDRKGDATFIGEARAAAQRYLESAAGTSAGR